MINEGLESKTLYVDTATGSDLNPGTMNLPLKTIGASVTLALSNKVSGLGTKVIIEPGLYPESITINGSLAQSTLPITFEAATSGTVYVTGAMPWTGWSKYSGNGSMYTMPWPYAWGFCAIDTGGPPLEQPVVLRREMIFVNSVMMTQVMALSQMLFPGTFFVDEAGGEVYLWPPTGTNINTADVEVAVNPSLLTIDGPGINPINGIVFRGIVFEYANTCHTASAVTVKGTASNILFDTDTFIWNNATGLDFNSPTANVTVMNSTSNHNGASGYNSYQTLNILWQDDTASYNNWRGAQGAFYEWGAAGAHLYSDHNETFTNFTSTFNETHSIHWDTDNDNITVTNFFSAQNMFGALLEKNYGPMTFTGGYFCATQVPTSSYGSGLILRDTLNATLTGNVFFDNSVTQIEVTGAPGGFPETNWATHQPYTALNENFTLAGNTIEGTTGQYLFQDSLLNGSDWTTFLTTFSSSGNTWWNATNPYVFEVPVPAITTLDDFAQWQALTGQDTNSTWGAPAVDPTAKCTVTAAQPDYWMVVDNDVVTTDAAGNAVFNLTTLAWGGMTGTVNLAIDGISAIPGATATLSPSTTTTSGSSVLTFNASTATPPGTYAFTVLANTGSVTRMIQLSATVPVSSVRLSTDALTFNNQPVGSTSPGQNITLTNTGTSPITIDSVALTFDFAESDNCVGTLAAGKSCTITITFSPTQVIPYNGTLTITDADPTSPQTVTLTGTTVGAPGISFSPKLLSFGAIRFMAQTQPQTITVTNNGTATLTISSVTITGTNPTDYSQTNTCSSVPIGLTCTISVTFAPTWSGSRTADVSVTDNVMATTPQMVSLSGTGESALSLAPASLGFGTIKIGNSSTKTATLSSTSTASIPITGITITGPNSGDFTQMSTCGATLAGNSSCTISVTYTPTVGGSESATLTITDPDPSSPQTLALAGTGDPVPVAVLTPASLTFSGEVYKAQSPAQQVTLSNNGTAALNITSIHFSGTNSGDFEQTDNCGGSVQVGNSCTINVTFTPTGLGTRSASLSVSDNATGSPQTTSVSGTGLTALTISPATLNFGSVPIGASSAQTVTITNASTSSVGFTSATIGGPNSADFSATNTCKKSIPANSSCTVSVTLKPVETGSLAATLTLTDLDPSSPQTVALSGNGGTQPSVTFSPASLVFGNEVYETPSAPLTTTMTNMSPSPMTITSIAVTGADKIDFSETNNCGTALAANASCAITVTFTPSKLGSRTAAITVTDDAVGSPQTVSLTGTGVTAITVAPTTLDFGTITVNQMSSLPVTITNAGAAAISVNSILLSGPDAGAFSQTNTCGTSLPGSSSCTITVTFQPVSSGSKTATLTIRDSDPSSPQTVSLSGTSSAASPGVQFSPVSLAFGNGIFQTPSAPMTTTLTNSGTASLSISKIAVTGDTSDFSETNTCGSAVAQGASCTITVTFTPAAIGARSASVSVTDNATGSPQTVSLTGTGLTALTITPASLGFGTVNVGSTSTLSLSIKNSSIASIAVTSFVFGGADPGDFSQTNTCGTSLAGNSSCTVSVTFKPASTGSRSGTLSIKDSDPSSPQVVDLTGTGSGSSGVSFSPSSLAFGNQPYQSPSATMTTTMSNTGTATLDISSITLTGSDTADFKRSTTCGTSLAKDASCTISITFVPTALGARTASISVSDSATGSPQTVPLTGTGISALTISPTVLTFGIVNSGTSATMQATVTNGSTASIGITNFSFSGADPGDFSQTNNCGSALGGNKACTITVTFKPTAPGSRAAVLMITDADPSSPQEITLSGTGGVPAVILSPTSLTFPSQALNKASKPQTVTLTNSGTGTLSFTGISITGGDKQDFTDTTTCKSGMAPGATCTLTVTFTPTALGARTAALTISDNVANSPQSVPLTGTGSALDFEPASSFDFGTVAIGSTGTFTVNLTNVDSLTVVFKDHLFIGANPGDFSETTTCGLSILPKATCTITFTFTPQATGLRTAQFQIDDNDASSPQILSFSGTGQ